MEREILDYSAREEDQDFHEAWRHTLVKQHTRNRQSLHGTPLFWKVVWNRMKIEKKRLHTKLHLLHKVAPQAAKVSRDYQRVTAQQGGGTGTRVQQITQGSEFWTRLVQLQQQRSNFDSSLVEVFLPLKKYP